MYKFAKQTRHQKSQIDNEEKVATSFIDRVKGRKCGEPEYCCLKPIVKGMVAITRYILAIGRNAVAEG